MYRSFFDLRKHSREICGLPPIIATTPSITFYSQFLCRVCNDMMIYSFTQCSKWQVTINTFELAHFGQRTKQRLPTCTKKRTCVQLGDASTGSLATRVSHKYEGCSNMNASGFITFFTYMLRQNGKRFYKGLYVTVAENPVLSAHNGMVILSNEQKTLVSLFLF